MKIENNWMSSTGGCESDAELALPGMRTDLAWIYENPLVCVYPNPNFKPVLAPYDLTRGGQPTRGTGNGREAACAVRQTS